MKGSQLQLIEKNQENMRLRFSFCTCIESKDWTILLVRIRFSTSQNRQGLWWPLISCILNHIDIIILLVLSRYPLRLRLRSAFACCCISFNPCPQLYPLILPPITILGPLIKNMVNSCRNRWWRGKNGKFCLINLLS